MVEETSPGHPLVWKVPLKAADPAHGRWGMMRRPIRSGLAACLLAGALAIAPASVAAPATASAKSLHEFEGRILSVNRDAHRFRMRDRHHGIVRIKVNSRTRYEHLSGFGALHKGLRVDVEARRSNGSWVAVEIERELPD